MIRVYCHGALRSCGGPWNVHAPHAVAACRLVAAQVPAFDAALRSGHFRVRVGPMGKGGRAMRNGFERMYLGRHNEIHLTPAGTASIGGQKGGALTKIIIGVALLGVGLTGGLAAGFGAAAIGTTGGFGISFGSIALAGASAALTGAAALISGSAQVARYENREAPEDRPNFLFSGAVNTVQEGGAVAWVWGKDVFIGSTVISAGIVDEQIGPGLPQPAVTGLLANFNTAADPVIQAAKGKKAKYRPPEESPDSLQSNAIANVLDLIGEGELELVDGLRSVYLDKTPVQNFDDTINFPGITLDWRSGTADQQSIAGINDIQIFQEVGGTATLDTPILATITDEHTNAVRVSVRLPQGLHRIDTSGDVRPTNVKYAVEHRVFGGDWVTDHDITLSGKASAGYSVSYRVSLEAGGHPWDVRLRRVSVDSESFSQVDQIEFGSMTRLIDARLRYPYSALAFLRIDSKAFGSDVPRRTYRVKRVDGLIPANYDPDLRTYDGFWDGSFKRGSTDNPAWGLRDLWTSTRYGCGEDILEEYVDDAALYAISQYCDGSVPDGNGGLEPRYRFNGSLTTREDAYQVLSSMAATFRGMIYWGPGTVVATQDRPSAVRQIVTPANTAKGGIKYEGIPLRHRFNILKVTWNDPEKQGGTAVTYVMDHLSIRKHGRREKDIYAWGATSEGQAHRMGKWEIEVAQNSSRIATWGAALKMADLMPGEIVAIADPTISGSTEHAGKIKSYDTNADTLTLDRPITMDPLKEYSIQFTGYDGTLIERVLVNGGVSATTVAITTPLPVPRPVRGADYVITASDLNPTQWQILVNAMTGKAEFGLTAIRFDPTKYDRVELDINLPPKPVSQLPSTIPLEPKNVNVIEYLYQAGSTPQWAAIIGWEAGDQATSRGFEVEYQRLDDGEESWQELGRPGYSLTRTLQNYTPGIYAFRIRAFSRIGARSDWTTFSTGLLGQQQPLADVELFRAAITGGFVTLRWSPLDDLRQPPYQIRFTPALIGAEWSQMAVMIDSVAGSQVNVPAQAGTYAIKAKSFYAESTNATFISIETVPSNFNVITVLEEDVDGWTGTRTNIVIDGAELVYEAHTSGDGIYQIANPFDLGDVYSARISVELEVVAADTEDILANWSTLAEVQTLAGVSTEDYSVAFQSRQTNDDPDASPIWTDFAPVIQGQYQARGHDFRIVVQTVKSSIEVRITKMRITIDMEDRFVTGQDIVSSTLGTPIFFDPPFLNDPKVFIVAQDMESGDYWRVTDKTTAGATVTFFDASNYEVSRTFDFIAIGYGKQRVP